MDTFLNELEKIWSNSFVKALVFLIIAFAAAFIVSFIVKKLCKLFKLDRKLSKWGVDEGHHGTALSFVGKLAFLIVFLIFLPPVFKALGLEGVSDPFYDFATTFVSYIPNIIAAVIFVFLGIFIGQIASAVVTVLLKKSKIDSLSEHFRKNSESDDSEPTVTVTRTALSTIVGRVLYAIILLIFIVQALTVLEIEAISTPALSIINAVFGAIPEIVLAIIVVTVGLFIASIATSVITGILEGLNFDRTVSRFVPVLRGKFSVTKTVCSAVRVIIILFVITQGVQILGLSVLTDIMTVIIGYLPMVVKALLIAFAAFVGASLLESSLKKSIKNSTAPKIAKAIIYTIAGFMIFSQLGFATTIVNFAFIIILSALALAFAIAFGIGGKDFAKKALDKTNVIENSEKENKDS